MKEYAPSARASGERRLVTVLFLDLSGFSGLCERRDPEQVTAVLNALFAEIVEVVELEVVELELEVATAALAWSGCE